MIEIEDYFKDIFENNKIDAVCMEKLFFTKYNKNNAEFVF
jgi:hypothetical protein